MKSAPKRSQTVPKAIPKRCVFDVCFGFGPCLTTCWSPVGSLLAPQIRSYIDPGCWKLTCGIVGLTHKPPQGVPRQLQEVPRSPQEAPRPPQEAPMGSPRGSKRNPRGPKKHPRQPQTGPNGTKNVPIGPCNLAPYNFSLFVQTICPKRDSDL